MLKIEKILLLFFLLNFFQLTGCKTNNQNEYLINRWFLSEIIDLEEGNVGYIERCFSLEFKRDNSYISNAYLEKEGLWSLENDQIIIDGRDTLQLQKLTQDSLIFINERKKVTCLLSCNIKK